MSTVFTNRQHQALLHLNGLGDFEALWNAKIAWFEEPNERRGGWSGVGRLALKASDGNDVQVFVKKQKNHGRRTFAHPIQGEPTFKREFNNLQFLNHHQFAAPVVVYYGEDNLTKRAILVTIALSEFQPLDEFSESKYKNWHESERVGYLRTLAKNIQRFHGLGMVHRALYPKHIFINTEQPSHVAVIDLEKARLTSIGWYRTYFDLAALFRHAAWWSKDEQLAFFKAYCVKLPEQELNGWQRWLFKRILKRAVR
ncbi:MAG TPA: lipopolysaccharide kinase InaA family protein [Methylotenera sp.]|nr:lipopolysaccharide kinase InaA family protein [Methylotenera sp.]